MTTTNGEDISPEFLTCKMCRKKFDANKVRWPSWEEEHTRAEDGTVLKFAYDLKWCRSCWEDKFEEKVAAYNELFGGRESSDDSEDDVNS